MRTLPVGFLVRPKVRLLRSWEGEPEAVLVEFRSPPVRAVRAVEPHADVLADLYVDGKDRPVSLFLLEPISGHELVKTVQGILRLSRTWKGCTRKEAQEIASLVLRGLFLGLERKIPAPGLRAMAALASA